MKQKQYLILLAFIALTIVILFQNCGKEMAIPKDGSSKVSERAIRSTSDLHRIIYSSNVENLSVDPLLTLDLNSGNLDVKVGTNLKSCQIDNVRAEELSLILDSGSICQPGVPAPGTAVCMAIGISDIKLSNNTDAVLLRPVICHNGAFLCNGQDEQFREIIQSLVTNPPVGCQ